MIMIVAITEITTVVEEDSAEIMIVMTGKLSCNDHSSFCF
jgi:hypothetical protein